MTLIIGERYVHYKHGPVEVIELRPNVQLGVKVRDARQDEFWIRTNDFPEELCKNHGDREFIGDLYRNGYTLRVAVPNEDELTRAEIEYFLWCEEVLERDHVYLRPSEVNNAGKKFEREWRLTFNIKHVDICPFPLIASGTSDHVNTHDQSNACGIIQNCGTTVVHWRSIVERLVRNGLRTSGKRR